MWRGGLKTSLVSMLGSRMGRKMTSFEYCIRRRKFRAFSFM
jgi:hypothetical protein